LFQLLLFLVWIIIVIKKKSGMMSSPLPTASSTSCGQCYLEQQEDEQASRDASSLDPIDEESLLSNLHKRFKKDQIYVSAESITEMPLNLLFSSIHVLLYLNYSAIIASSLIFLLSSSH
jgi:hypothetical protein